MTYRRNAFLSMIACVLLLATTLSAMDVPVQGTRLSMRARDGEPARRTTKLLVRDPAIGSPLPDPRTGSGVVLSGGAAAGQCRVELALDPTKWHTLGDDGAPGAYVYLDRTVSSQGVRRIVLRPGAFVLEARGAEWACDLSADELRVPVSVELRAADRRYCAAFGGIVDHNEPGRFSAHEAPSPAACAKSDLTVANLNILHGLFCPRPTFCRLADRLDLLFQWIAHVGCPDVVTLQEVSAQAMPLITARLGSTCPFTYQQVYIRTTIGTDDEMILSRYPIVTHELKTLYPGFRTVLFVRIDHPIGPVDVFSTHLASSSDGAQSPCATTGCPAECTTVGATNTRECQAVQMARFIAERHDVTTPAVATGDFNEPPESFVYNQFVGRGWTDVHLAAGNPECDPDTGIGCTSGRQDENLTELESPASNEDERIDFIFLVPPASGSLCAGTIDSSADADGDSTATGIFAGEPNPFAPTCGPAPAAICWTSDHEGAQLDLNCDGGSP